MGDQRLFKKDFQIDSGQMALSTNDLTTERSLADHSAASKHQLELIYDEFNELNEEMLNKQISKHQPFDSQLSIIRQYVEMPFYVNCLYPN